MARNWLILILREELMSATQYENTKVEIKDYYLKKLVLSYNGSGRMMMQTDVSLLSGESLLKSFNLNRQPIVSLESSDPEQVRFQRLRRTESNPAPNQKIRPVKFI